MTPLKQTIFSDEKKGTVGNCLQTCVASLLDLPIESVPHFSWYMSDWFRKLYMFLEEKGYSVKMLSVKTNPDWRSEFKGLDGYIIMGGGSPRGVWNGHAVIYKDGEPFFDPHPDNTFLTTEEDFYVIERGTKYKYKAGDLLEISMLHHYAVGNSSGHGIQVGTVVEVIRQSIFHRDTESHLNGKPSYICRVFNEPDEKEVLEDELCIPN
jgi:hypothetical protein